MTLSVQLRHSFPDFALDVAFEAPAGVTALFGQSGSGKTSVINAVAGLLHPDQGHIACGGQVLLDTATKRDLPVHRRRLGYVFQEARLFPHLTVRQNLLYGHWFAPKGATLRFDRVVEMLGIGPLLTRRPAALSGGEKQRVAIGRALLCNPQILLMDEPLAALDEARKAEILPYLERLRDLTEIPILYVSHSMAEVARLATTLVLLHEGKVTRAGPAGKVLADPAAASGLGLRGAGAVMMARLVAQEEDDLSRLETSAGVLRLPRIDAPIGSSVRIRIHAQDVILSRTRPEGLSALNILPAVITQLRLGEGSSAWVQMRAGQDLLLSRITQRSAKALALHEGAECFVILKSMSVAQQDIGAQDIGAF
jgi:molybdate transport system ATP-binding protein